MICVTGATGTVGSELIQQLEKSNIPFRAALHSEKKANDFEKRGISSVVIDYGKSETLIPAFNKCDKVFLLGPNVENQTELELNVVEAATTSGVRHIVKLSVTNAHKESYSLARVHRPVEKAIETSGLGWTFLRCNQFMQNLATYGAETIKADNAIYSASSDAKISQLDVRDIAEVAIKVMTEEGHTNKIYSLTGPSAFTYNEAAAELSKVLGHTISHINLSPADFKQGMIAEGVSEEIANRLTDLERYFRDGEPSVVSNDIKMLLGREARSFSDFVKESSSTVVWGEAE